MDELDGLKSAMGVVQDDGELKDGYRFFIDHFGDNQELVDKLRALEDENMGDQPLLVLEFTGFPTDETIDVIEALDKSFPIRPQGLRARLMGRFGLRS
jgi:hypothetical protein